MITLEQRNFFSPELNATIAQHAAACDAEEAALGKIDGELAEHRGRVQRLDCADPAKLIARLDKLNLERRVALLKRALLLTELPELKRRANCERDEEARRCADGLKNREREVRASLTAAGVTNEELIRRAVCADEGMARLFDQTAASNSNGAGMQLERAMPDAQTVYAAACEAAGAQAVDVRELLR